MPPLPPLQPLPPTPLPRDVIGRPLSETRPLIRGRRLSAATSWESGRDFLPRARCHAGIEAATGVTCDADYGKQFPDVDCVLRDASIPPEVQSEFVWDVPTLGEEAWSFASTHWIRALRQPPPPPSPSPHPPPVPPFGPPSAPPSPSPPVVLEWHEVLARAHEAQKAMCTQVYVKSIRERCDAFAVAMGEYVAYEPAGTPWPPPSAPPMQRIAAPMSPGVAGGLGIAIHAYRMTTHRLPASAAAPRAEADGFEVAASTRATIEAELAAMDGLGSGSGSGSGSGFPLACLGAGSLPCATGTTSDDACLDGEVRCGDVQPPAIELEFDLSANTYLAAVEIELPAHPELASLFYPLHTLRVLDKSSRPLCEVTPEDRAAPASRRLALACPAATDAQVLELSTAARARIELPPGEGRRLWLKSVSLVALVMPETTVAPPPPPPMAAATTAASASASASASPPPPCTYTEHIRHRFPTQFLAARIELPCGTPAEACCAMARERGMQAFALNDAGCCSAVNTTGPSVELPLVANCFSSACMVGMLV